MRHEFERATHGGTVGGSAEADAHGFGRRSVGDESIAGNDAHTGRSSVANKRRAGPRLRQRQPKVEADRNGAVAMARQAQIRLSGSERQEAMINEAAIGS